MGKRVTYLREEGASPHNSCVLLGGGLKDVCVCRPPTEKEKEEPRLKGEERVQLYSTEREREWRAGGRNGSVFRRGRLPGTTAAAVSFQEKL